MVSNFHKFVINEKDNPSEGGNSIRRGKKEIDQNSPSKSGIEYKKNMSYQKADTGGTSYKSYVVFVTEAINAIDEMSSIAATAKPEINSSTNSEKTSLGSQLKPTVESHLKLWDDLERLAEKIDQEKPKNESIDDISDEYQKAISIIDKEKEEGKITEDQADDKKAETRKKFQERVDKAQALYYRKMDEAFPYFVNAIKAFKQGAILEIKNIDKEEAKSDNIKSESNFTDWLDQATNATISILYKNKK